MITKIAHNERESRTLAALRDTLLPELISGGLRIDNIGDVFIFERDDVAG